MEDWDDAESPCRMRKKAVQQGRSEQRGESYSVPYVEPLSDARTPLADFFRILLEKRLHTEQNVVVSVPMIVLQPDRPILGQREPRPDVPSKIVGLVPQRKF
jgi:hypothetical protein